MLTPWMRVCTKAGIEALHQPIADPNNERLKKKGRRRESEQMEEMEEIVDSNEICFQRVLPFHFQG